MAEDVAKSAAIEDAIRNAVKAILPADAKVVINVSVKVYVATGSSNVEFPKEDNHES